MPHPDFTLTIPVDIHTHILAHARAQYPHECCGLIIGRPARKDKRILLVDRSVAATNHAVATDHGFAYAIDSRFWLQQDRLASASGLEVIGIYHSHPDHPAVPSATDLRLAWPVYVYIIVSVSAAHTPSLRAWVIDADGKQFVEVPVRTVHR